MPLKQKTSNISHDWAGLIFLVLFTSLARDYISDTTICQFDSHTLHYYTSALLLLCEKISRCHASVAVVSRIIHAGKSGSGLLTIDRFMRTDIHYAHYAYY